MSVEVTENLYEKLKAQLIKVALEMVEKAKTLGVDDQSETIGLGNSSLDHDADLFTLANSVSEVSKLLDVKSPTPEKLSGKQTTLDRWLRRTGTGSSEKKTIVPDFSVNEQAINYETSAQANSSVTGSSEVNVLESSKDNFIMHGNADTFNGENVTDETNCDLSVREKNDGEATETESINLSDIVSLEESAIQNCSDIYIVNDFNEDLAQGDIDLFANSVGEIEISSTFNELPDSIDLPDLNVINQSHDVVDNSENSSPYNLRTKRKIIPKMKEVHVNRKLEFNSCKYPKNNDVNDNIPLVADDASSNASKKSPRKRKQNKISKSVSNFDDTELSLVRDTDKSVDGEKDQNLNVSHNSIETPIWTETNIGNLEVSNEMLTDVCQYNFKEKSVYVNIQSSSAAKSHYQLRRRTCSQEGEQDFDNTADMENIELTEKSFDSEKDSLNSLINDSLSPVISHDICTFYDGLIGENVLDGPKNTAERTTETNMLNPEDSSYDNLSAKLPQNNIIKQYTGTSKYHYRLRKRARSQEDLENSSIVENNRCDVEMGTQIQAANQRDSLPSVSDKTDVCAGNREILSSDTPFNTKSTHEDSEIKISKIRKETKAQKKKSAKNKGSTSLKNREKLTESQDGVVETSALLKQKYNSKQSLESFECSQKTDDTENDTMTFKQNNEGQETNMFLSCNSHILINDKICPADVNHNENVQSYPVMEVIEENFNEVESEKSCSSKENCTENGKIQVLEAFKYSYKSRRKIRTQEDSDPVLPQSEVEGQDEEIVKKQSDNEKESHCVYNSSVSNKTCTTNVVHADAPSTFRYCRVHLVRENNIPKISMENNNSDIIEENNIKNEISVSPKYRYKLRTRRTQQSKTNIGQNNTDHTLPEGSNCVQEVKNVTCKSVESYSENHVEELNEMPLYTCTNPNLEAEQKSGNVVCDVESKLNNTESSSHLATDETECFESEQISVLEVTPSENSDCAESSGDLISENLVSQLEKSEDLISENLISQLEKSEDLISENSVFQLEESPVKELTEREKINFECFSNLKESCASLNINIEDIFEQKGIEEWLNKKHENSDAIVFIGKHQLQERGKIVPIVYTHRSKQELWDTLCKITGKTGDIK